MKNIKTTLRKITCLGFMLMLANTVQAQLYVGVEAGTNKNFLISNTGDRAFFEYQPLYGWSGSVVLRYEFRKIASWFGGIQISPGYITKNYRAQRTGAYSRQYEQYTNSYFEIPLMLNVHFGGYIDKKKRQTLRGMLNIGGFMGHWMQSRVLGRAPSVLDPLYFQRYDVKYTFNHERDNRVAFGGLLGLGLKYEPVKGYLVTVEGRYSPLLTDIQKKYQMDQTPKYHDTYSLLVGVQFSMEAIRNNFFKFKKDKEEKTRELN